MSLDEHARAGLRAIEERRYDDAITSFQKVLEVEPNRPDMNHALGMAFVHRGDVGNAIPHLEAAVKLAEPYNAPEHQPLKLEFHMSLATSYQLMDQVGKARAALEEVVRRWPDHVEARLQLGQLLLSTCQLQDGLQVYKEAADYLDKEQREAAEALVGSAEAFLESEHEADVFLKGHQESYVSYFDEVAKSQPTWHAEAMRAAMGPDGEPQPVLAEGARPYALSRVDLVNPADNTVSGVYSEQEPMIVALHGLEPLAQAPVMIPWDGGWPFEAWVCSRSPWHWLGIIVQFQEPADSEEALVNRVDELIGDWYLQGFNGEFGSTDRGYFHYIGDPEPMGDRAVAYAVDLGRAGYEAIPALLTKLTVLHDRAPIQRVLFGYGRLPN
jgi:tetratricopeptide (TPR) repeat protein